MFSKLPIPISVKDTIIKHEVFLLVLKILIKLNLQGVANRGCSIRVGRDTEKNGKGRSFTTILWSLDE